MHHHDEGLADDGRDRRDVADEIVIELVVERCADDVVHAGHEQGIAVRRCAHDSLGANKPAGTWSVLHNEWLAQPL